MDEEEKRKKNEGDTHKDRRKERDQVSERVHEYEFLAFLGYFAEFYKKTPYNIIPPIHSSVQQSSWHCGVAVRRGHG